MLKSSEIKATRFACLQGDVGHVLTILGFLDHIGIPWGVHAVPATSFLPGIEILAGEIQIDPEKLAHPGDILHEAGHIAVSLPGDRKKLSGDIGAEHGENLSPEMAVIPWSYAACKHLGLPSEVLFHPEGYKGNSDFLLEEFDGGNPLGLPLLAWMGFCACPGMPQELPAFPHLVKWLRE